MRLPAGSNIRHMRNSVNSQSRFICVYPKVYPPNLIVWRSATCDAWQHLNRTPSSAALSSRVSNDNPPTPSPCPWYWRIDCRKPKPIYLFLLPILPSFLSWRLLQRTKLPALLPLPPQVWHSSLPRPSHLPVVQHLVHTPLTKVQRGQFAPESLGQLICSR